MKQDNPIADDDSYWIRMMGTRWSEPSLSSADVAALLDIGDPAELQCYAPQLAAPGWDAHGETWSRAAVYNYILVHQPQWHARIPRLYPFTTALGPAQFLFGVVVDGMAVHAWQPADGRGPVAVAYAGHGQNDNDLSSRVESMLARLPWATAVCCPSTSPCVTVDGEQQPYVAVGDRNHGVDANYAWFEVVGLLRVDLPWWPAPLRDIEAIAAWQPGAPVQRIRPRSGQLDPRRLSELLTTRTPGYVAGLVGRAIEILDRQAARYIDRMPGRRGLIHAAAADLGPQPTAADDITEAEGALLLSQHCADAATADEILELLKWCSPIAGVNPIPIRSNPLAAEWIKRLQPAEDDRELGFWRARIEHGVQQPMQAYRDPWNPRSWAVATSDTIYAAVARSVPATGQLTELFYEQQGGMFRDSCGRVWPLPATGFGATGTGPSGGRDGRVMLVQIVTNLILDACGDVNRRQVPYSPTSPLAELVARTEPPLVIRAADPVLAIFAA